MALKHGLSISRGRSWFESRSKSFEKIELLLNQEIVSQLLDSKLKVFLKIFQPSLNGGLSQQKLITHLKLLCSDNVESCVCTSKLKLIGKSVLENATELAISDGSSFRNSSTDIWQISNLADQKLQMCFYIDDVVARYICSCSLAGERLIRPRVRHQQSTRPFFLVLLAHFSVKHSPLLDGQRLVALSSSNFFVL